LQKSNFGDRCRYLHHTNDGAIATRETFHPTGIKPDFAVKVFHDNGIGVVSNLGSAATTYTVERVLGNENIYVQRERRDNYHELRRRNV
jgi:hypothetical protein